MVLSTLTIRQCNEAEFIGVKPLMICSFGNIDLSKSFHNILNELKQEGDLDRKRVKS
jgi:hypothetical protein